MTEAVARDLAPASGVVIAVEPNQILIDLDATDSLKSGDMVAVLGKGRKLVHPDTGKRIGTLETTKAILSVYRVRNGFSHARRVGTSEDGVRPGDKVRRFEEMPVRFWDYTGAGEGVFRRLRDALPTLEWGDYDTDQTARPGVPKPPNEWEGLLMILKEDQLEIRDPDFRLLYTYRPETEKPAPAGASKKAKGRFPAESVSSGVSVQSHPVSPSSSSKTATATMVAPEFGTMHHYGPMPEGTTTMAAFLTEGDRLLMATGSGPTVRVFTVGDELRELAAVNTGVDSNIYAVQWWHPDDADGPFVAVTAYGDEKMASAVYALEKTGLRRVKGFIPAILGTMDRDGDGRPETLLRQSFDRDVFWGTRIRELSLAGNGLADRSVPMETDRSFTAVGSLTADLTGNGRAELVVIRGQALRVFSEGEILFETTGMGGSLSRLIYAVNPEQQDVLTSGETLEIDPIAADLDGDGRPELIAPASAQSTLSVAGIYTGFKSTQLAVFKYRDGQFIQGTLGEVLDHPVQGMTVHDGRVYLVTSQPGNLLGKGGQSRLMSFRLAVKTG